MISRAFGRRVLVSALLAVAGSVIAADDGLSEPRRLYDQGQAAQALQQLNAYLTDKPRDAQARFLKGVILTELNNPGDAIQVFSALTQDFPELPEPYNNLAVLYASQGQYEKAKTSLELAVRAHPGYATAHENLGDIYAQLALREYEKVTQLDKSNQSVGPKLKLIKQMQGGGSGK